MNYMIIPGISPHLCSIADKIAAIELAVCEFYGLKMEDINSHRRWPRLIEARQMIYLALRHKMKMHVTTIGDMFDRDHSTIIHALRTAQNLLDTEETFVLKQSQIQSIYEKKLRDRARAIAGSSKDTGKIPVS